MLGSSSKTAKNLLDIELNTITNTTLLFVILSSFTIIEPLLILSRPPIVLSSVVLPRIHNYLYNINSYELFNKYKIC